MGAALRHEVTVGEKDEAPIQPGRAWAAIGVVLLALSLAALPAVAALGLLPTQAEGMGRAAIALAALLGAGKVAAAAVALIRSPAAAEL